MQKLSELWLKFKNLIWWKKALLLISFLSVIIILLYITDYSLVRPSTSTQKLPVNDKKGENSQGSDARQPTTQYSFETSFSNSQQEIIIDDRDLSAINQKNLSITVAETPQIKPNEVRNPVRVVIYGFKSQNQIEIREVNIDGTNNHPIAYLAANIKDIHPVSDHALLYIAGVDEFDHGSRVEIYDTKTQSVQTVTSASPSFGIDDIIISPDNRYLAIWEVKFVPGQKVMLNGLSSVYLFNLQTSEKIQVILETATSGSVIHYPRLIGYDDKLYLDTWSPNQGRQFFRGMSYVTPNDPTQLIPIPKLAGGKFSSAPLLSPVGNKVVFSGFDASSSITVPVTAREYPKRPELDNPNQIVILNLDDFTTTVYTDKRNTRFYVDPKWSADGTKVLYTRYNPQPSTVLNKPAVFEGIYSLDLNTLNETKMANLTDENIRPIKFLGTDNLIYQLRFPTQGNLGEKYAQVSEGFYKYENGVSQSIATGGNLQYLNNLTLLPKLGLGSDKNIKSLSAFTLPDAPLVPPQKDKSVTFENLEIDPLAYRAQQQNDPIKATANNSTLNPDASATPEPSSPPTDDGGDDGGGSCADNWNCGEGYPTSACWVDYLGSECHDSPLYLYPQKTSNIRIKPIVSGQIQYEWPKLTGNLWQVVAFPDGELISKENISFDKIEYSYTTSLVRSPEKGLIAKAAQLESVLSSYASKVGLNEREANDFISFWIKELNKVPSPYYFISHYDKETASKIMSFDINPRPDTFIQVVMYFKPLNNPISVSPPVFNPVPLRSGFVAVDWSGKIDL
ncbi:hypothetical protein A2960_00005 [Candidatus Gottesmanbacteria bacterium RIFCSPLOWO2_01_FULL_39_12b]|uniref:Uncharacterized protein n=1 Tax=Candidatus Gottesmanbacteria bacterium RIFCSPLOWO2_01_FULL_39_12b TaxID=1798388 RepID=A0A1F6ARL9_9BACT|nr:MAG: hypothetical protein A2960_00005 [Candidatus Gottesmanbacteria bacterium RIFCSPLOWO2_01_FULL_39_12b]